jgi:hypothetical protein
MVPAAHTILLSAVPVSANADTVEIDFPRILRSPHSKYLPRLSHTAYRPAIKENKIPWA